jgi:hypothetical protein
MRREAGYEMRDAGCGILADHIEIIKAVQIMNGFLI